MEREDQISLAMSSLPGLRQLATEVLEFLTHLRLSDIPWADMENDETARADYMVRTMVLIQIEHLRSVSSLVNHGHDRDASIVARSIVECLAQTVWALTEEPIRTDLWFWYTIVLERLQLIKNQERNLPFDIGAWATSERLISLYGPSYFNDRALRAVRRSEPLPSERERYRYRWHEEDIAVLIRSTLGDGPAVDYWRSASAWAHSSPLTVVRAMDQGDGPTRYDPSDAREAAQALYMAIHCCLNTFQLATQRFQLPHLDQLNEFFSRLPGSEDEAVNPMRGQEHTDHFPQANDF